MQEDRYVFETEWFDAQADLIRKYLLTFYPTDGTIEMVSLLYLAFAWGIAFCIYS